MQSFVLNDVIDSQPIGRYQKLIIGLCMALMVLDGYDIQAMAYAAPLIMENWQIDKTVLGVVFSAALGGLFVGSLVLSNLSDRFGRRPIMLISTLAFSILMLLTPSVTSLSQLAVMRFITGIFLGGIMPNAMAYSSDIVPSKNQVFVMVMISAGYTLGAMLGGFVASALKPLGWQAIFYFGGVIPLILFFVLYAVLPESQKFLASRAGNDKKIIASLRKFYPHQQFDDNAQITVNDTVVQKASPLELFRDNRAFFTSTIWIISILNMISLYFLSSWLPTLSKEAGLTTNQALMVGSVLQFGALLGSLAMGAKIKQYGFYKVLIPVFVLAIISVGLIGISVNSLTLLFIVVFLAGFTVIGGQPAINALSASHYPVLLRTTGVGWSIGIARLGSMIGPILGGALAKSVNLSSLFLIATIPSMLVIVMLVIQAKFKNKAEMGD